MDNINEVVITTIGYNEDAPQITRSDSRFVGEVTGERLRELLSRHLVTVERVLDNPDNKVETKVHINGKTDPILQKTFADVIELLNNINVKSRVDGFYLNY